MQIKLYTKFFRILFAIYIVTLFFLLLYSFNNISIEIRRSFFGVPLDKIIHFLLFFPFSICLHFAFGDVLRPFFKSYYILFVLLIGIIIAVTAEYSQLFTDYRDFDYKDMEANVISIFTSTIIVYVANKISLYRIKKISTQKIL